MPVVAAEAAAEAAAAVPHRLAAAGLCCCSKEMSRLGFVGATSRTLCVMLSASCIL